MCVSSVIYYYYYTVFQKSDAKIQITITMAHLIRINYPLSSFNYRLVLFNTGPTSAADWHYRVCRQEVWQQQRTYGLHKTKRHASVCGNGDHVTSRTKQCLSYILFLQWRSLGWVTPGAATEGITPLFFPKNLATFFAHHCHYHYRFLLLSLGCHPLQGVTPHFFYLSDLVSPLFFVNLPTKNFFLRVSPPGGCYPGRSAVPASP